MQQDEKQQQQHTKQQKLPAACLKSGDLAVRCNSQSLSQLFVHVEADLVHGHGRSAAPPTGQEASGLAAGGGGDFAALDNNGLDAAQREVVGRTGADCCCYCC